MKKIILIDDDPGIQDAVRLVLEEHGYNVVILTNGESLLNNEFEMPDLFLLDKQLSGVDGLDICRHLKKQITTAHIPVIILSASPHIGRLAAAAGAEDALEKPFRTKELKEMIEKHLVKDN